MTIMIIDVYDLNTLVDMKIPGLGDLNIENSTMFLALQELLRLVQNH